MHLQRIRSHIHQWSLHCPRPDTYHSIQCWDGASREQSRYAPSQWETALQCNAISHWLGEYLDWSLCQPVTNLPMAENNLADFQQLDWKIVNFQFQILPSEKICDTLVISGWTSYERYFQIIGPLEDEIYFKSVIFKLISPVTGEFTSQRPEMRALIFSLIWNAGDLRRHRAHYDVTVMLRVLQLLWNLAHILAALLQCYMQNLESM